MRGYWTFFRKSIKGNWHAFFSKVWGEKTRKLADWDGVSSVRTRNNAAITYKQKLFRIFAADLPDTE